MEDRFKCRTDSNEVTVNSVNYLAIAARAIKFTRITSLAPRLPGVIVERLDALCASHVAIDETAHHDRKLVDGKVIVADHA